MEGKTEEKQQTTSEKKSEKPVDTEKPKEVAKPIEEPVKQTNCSIICGEVNYII